MPAIHRKTNSKFGVLKMTATKNCDICSKVVDVKELKITLVGATWKWLCEDCVDMQRFKK
jgi:ribosome-binding protein aMBF1 (putative translation factor)